MTAPHLDPDKDDTPPSQRETPLPPEPVYTLPPTPKAILFVLDLWRGLKRS